MGMFCKYAATVFRQTIYTEINVTERILGDSRELIRRCHFECQWLEVFGLANLLMYVPERLS